jgi:NAD(P) transhydrogenase subunit alpha
MSQLMLSIGVPRETTPGETRVALVPQAVAPLLKAGLSVQVEAGAGVLSGATDEAYVAAGATIVDARAAFGSDVVLKVREPRWNEEAAVHETDLLRDGAVLIALLGGRTPQSLERLAAHRVTAFALEALPRITRAQSMDVMSSMSTVAGYRAVLLAAEKLPRFFPLLMTAAGTIPPARVFVIGAGVAGLQAIATARRLGAVVEAFDVRPAVREEVQSLGATFIAADVADAAHAGAGGYAKELNSSDEQRERERLTKHVQSADVVITTAVVPGKRAPLLITTEMVQGMRPGSVIVDMAAESGGNCELTRAGTEVQAHGVTIVGPVNLAAGLAVHASQMFARNVATLVLHLTKNGALALDFDDEITRTTCVLRDGRAAGATAPTNGPAATVTNGPVAAGAAAGATTAPGTTGTTGGPALGPGGPASGEALRR